MACWPKYAETLLARCNVYAMMMMFDEEKGGSVYEEERSSSSEVKYLLD